MSRRITDSHVTDDSVTIKIQSMGSPSAIEVRELVARRAYELYTQRDAVFGDDMSDWLQAEGEIMAILLAETPETRETNIPIDQLAKRSTKAVRTAKPAKEPRQRVTRRSKRNDSLISNPA